MDPGARRPPRPPALLRVLGRLLIRGRDASFIVHDLDVSFTRDVERGLGRRRAVRRYAWNVVASAWSVWIAGLRSVGTHGIGLDAKLGLRMLVKQPLITVVAGLVLGLGIPGSLTLVHGFDVIYGRFPAPDADRMAGIRHYDVEARSALLSTVDDYERWADLASFDAIGAARSYTVNVNGEEAGASPVLAARITASSFGVLRARPIIGRLFDADDERDGAPDVVLVGETLWSARFARDPDIVGTSVRIGSTPHTVVGVLPSDFGFPLGQQVWVPLRDRTVDLAPGTGPRAYVFGRLADGVSIEDARVEMAGLTALRANDDPERFEHLNGELVDMPLLLLNERDDGIMEAEGALLQTMIFMLLLVVCGNVGTLVLARTAQRSAEIAIRTALGASRRRILTQLFVEALLLAVGATTIGLLCANALATRVPQMLPEYGFPYWADFALTPRIVSIALGLAVLCAAVIGVLPALRPTRQAIQANLQSAGTRGSPAGFGVVSTVLIVSQIVLSVGFLAMGAARMTSAVRHEGRNMGFDPDRYVLGTLTVPNPDPIGSPTTLDSLAWNEHVAATQRRLLARLSEDPAVVGAGMGLDMPGINPPGPDVTLETPPDGFGPAPWDPGTLRVDVAFFSGLHRPILAGRDFNASDVEGPPGTRHTAVIVNESFVRDFMGGRNAIGQRLRYTRYSLQGTPGDEEEWYEVVGVVGAFGTNPHTSSRDAAIYHPLAPGEVNPIRYAVEVADDPEAFVTRLRQIAASVDREATVDSELLSASRAAGMMSLLVLVFAGAAFLLSATGLYALMSFTVSQRTREIGIRTALGARAADIVSTVARRAAIQISVGLTLGVGLGWRLLDGQRYQRALEFGNIPLTLAMVAAVAGCVCLLACAYPTRRGLRIQPTEALRES